MSAHFTLQEFLHSNTALSNHIENLPAWENIDNLKHLADTMEKVRTILGSKPVTITSGFRAPNVNAAVGGVSNSAHLYGFACDFVVPSFGTPLTICKALEPHIAELDIDQLIHEFGDWVHLGLSASTPRHMAMTISNSGTVTGFV